VSAAPTQTVEIVDLATLAYRPAWDRQLELHAHVADHPGHAGFLVLVEHPPVITIGRHPGSARHLLASASLLASRGVEVVETDRGGDITFHGPGQLVAYPIIPLNFYNLNLHAYMRMLEETVIRTIGAWGLAGERIAGATGVWVDAHTADGSPDPRDASTTPGSELRTQNCAKVCAMGVKLRRWITLHGLALNVTTDLTFFDLINPCGLGLPVTSLQRLLGPRCPTMAEAKRTLAAVFRETLAEHAGQNGV